MKRISFVLVFLITYGIQGQTLLEEAELQRTVETFFEGFHKQDSVLIKTVVADGIILQSIGKNKDGETALHQDSFGEFLKAIVGIPSEKEFREELHSFSIEVDGDMANVWTPYSFYFDGKFSHCGVNSFQLIKINGDWKIFYLVDTRRRENCEE